MLVRRLLPVILLLCAAAPTAFAQVEPAEKETAGRESLRAVIGQTHMIAAAHPLASQAGLDILRAGGSAVDAAIAVQLVLSLVEPQSSGVGGGGFLMTYDAATGVVRAIDGRESAPAMQTQDFLLDADGKPVPISEAIQGGRVVGVPGAFRMLERAHQLHGKLPWADLFAPAIRLAEDGFAVTPRLSEMIGWAQRFLVNFPAAAQIYLTPDGAPLAVGTILKAPAYAALLRTVAAGGADAYYTGTPAKRVVAAVRTSPVNPGPLTLQDMAQYRAIDRDPVCGRYRAYRICSMGPPSSAATTMLAALGMLERFDLAALGPNSPASIHLIAEALAIAFADREVYLADDAFIDVPVAGLIDADYLATRSALIDPAGASPIPDAGTPPDLKQAAQGRDPGHALPSTSHWVVVDSAGNTVTATGTVQAPFGAFLLVDGYLLNNELTDFAANPLDDGKPVANRLEPGKRPRSSMAPTLVFDPDGQLIMALGSAGGSGIIGHVTKTIIAALDWNMDMQQAIHFPNFFRSARGLSIEQGSALEGMKDALEAMGHQVAPRQMTSGLHGIAVDRSGPAPRLIGGADPRREGVVLAD